MLTLSVTPNLRQRHSNGAPRARIACHLQLRALLTRRGKSLLVRRRCRLLPVRCALLQLPHLPDGPCQLVLHVPEGCAVLVLSLLVLLARAPQLSHAGLQAPMAPQQQVDLVLLVLQQLQHLSSGGIVELRLAREQLLCCTHARLEGLVAAAATALAAGLGD